MARETKHTPGTWSIEPGENKGAWIGNENGWAALACGNTDEEALANASLIAASPELLEALKGLLSWSAHLPFAADDKVEFARNVIKIIEQ